ncbi:hypothetical protein KY330_00935 [Candidatus Woesearchaeota archaeon]|nr:hypothetical protein [Candidatus Woesearchaeota archaeon]
MTGDCMSRRSLLSRMAGLGCLLLGTKDLEARLTKLEREWRETCRKKDMSPESHWNIDGRYGYIAKIREEVEPVDYVSKFYMQNWKSTGTYDSSQHDNTRFERLINMVFKARYGSDFFSSKDATIRLKVMERKDYLTTKYGKGRDGYTYPRAIGNKMHYTIYTDCSGSPFGVAEICFHERAHLCCRNPKPFYDEMYALRAGLIMLSDLVGDYLPSLFDSYVNIQKNKDNMHGKAWRLSDRLIQERFGIEPFSNILFINSRNRIAYRINSSSEIKRMRKQYIRASARLCNELNNNKKFNELVKGITYSEL